MWKSLVARTDGSVDTGPNNPQADSCIDPNIGSTYILTEGMIPAKATVERAFLIWMAVVDPAQLSAPTDNSVTLSFQHTTVSELNLSQEVTASYVGFLSPTSNKDFEFEGITYADPGGGSDGAFTYRVDVTAFFNQIQAKGNELGIVDPGTTLLGSYNVKGVTCSAAQAYKTSSGLMAGWAIVIVYSAEGIHAKKIYFYNGLMPYRFTSADIMVSGFQLPNEAEIRMTLIVGEGDPGLYTATNPNIEGLQLHGPIDPNAPWLPLFDACNPNMGNYVEVYNSISSLWPIGATQPICIGDINTKILEYAMDVDTFVINAKYEPFATHLHKDDTFFFLKIGANQDQVYTNLLVLSIDTRPPSFDIPEGTPFSPNGREKDVCTCAPANEPDRVCPDRPFYYVIKVQNWGENLADNVTVQDTLPPEVDYIPGTTEIATSFDGTNGTNWTVIPDNNGIFPLSTPYQVWATGMGYCDPVSQTCPDSVLIRFKVRPKGGLPKHQLIKNSAYIADVTGVSYQTNTSVPLTLRLSDSCPPITECPEPPKALCGGEGGGAECTTKEQCGPSQDCIDGHCVDVTPTDICSATNVQYRVGDMSPSNGDAKIIVPSPSSGLVVAQLAITGTCGDSGEKSFHLDMIRPKFEFDTGVTLTNLRLVKDKNNNGIEDEGDTTVATVATLANTYAQFAISSSERTLAANTEHNFLVIADAVYTGATIGYNTTFRAVIEGSAAFVSPSTESVTFGNNRLEFATFMFEPSSGYFIFTKGPKEPPEPPFNQLNQSNPVMHIRAKSLDGENQIRSIEIHVTSVSTLFGEGMQAIDIFEDTNGDGIGDILAATSGTFSEPTDVFLFENLNALPAFQFSNKQERYYAINVTFKLAEGMTAQIQIPAKGVKLVDSTKKVIELPIQSRTYQCVNPFCEGGTDGGCSCSLVTSDDDTTSRHIALLGLNSLILLLLLYRRLQRRKHAL